MKFGKTPVIFYSWVDRISLKSYFNPEGTTSSSSSELEENLNCGKDFTYRDTERMITKAQLLTKSFKDC